CPERETLAARRRQQVGLELDGEDGGARGHQRIGGDAAGIVEARTDDSGMDEAVLLREIGRIAHRQIDLARFQPCARHAEGAHRRLRVEGLGCGLSKVRIFWRKARHQAIAGTNVTRCLIAISRIAGANSADLRSLRSMCTPVISQVATISCVSTFRISCRKRIDFSRISRRVLLTSTMSPASSSRL